MLDILQLLNYYNVFFDKYLPEDITLITMLRLQLIRAIFKVMTDNSF